MREDVRQFLSLLHLTSAPLHPPLSSRLLRKVAEFDDLSRFEIGLLAAL